MNRCLYVIGLLFLILSGLMLSSGKDVEDPALNMLSNGDFEQGTADWTYSFLFNNADWKTDPRARNGQASLFLISTNDGCHEGPCQSVQLRTNWIYKISAWIKADMQPKSMITMLICSGGNAGVRTNSMDWTSMEKVFTNKTSGRVNVAPVFLQGKASVWVDDVRLEDRGPAYELQERAVYRFSDPAAWTIKCHQDQKPSEVLKGVELVKTSVAGTTGNALNLRYVFASPRHDAVMLERTVDVGKGRIIELTVWGDGSGHELFLALMDSGGEWHYLPVAPIRWVGWQKVYADLDTLLTPPKWKGTVDAIHWGGDVTQTLEWPVTRVIIGINDKPDSFMGRGSIAFQSIRFVE